MIFTNNGRKRLPLNELAPPQPYTKDTLLLNSQDFQDIIVYVGTLEIDPNINPNDISALNNKGNALANLGDYSEAIQYYDRALEIDTNDTLALNGKGNVLYDLGRYEEAIRYFDKVLTIDANNISALNNKGAALANLDNSEENNKYLNKVLEQQSNATRVSYNENEDVAILTGYVKNRQYSAQDLKQEHQYAILLNDLDRYEDFNGLHYISSSTDSKSKIVDKTTVDKIERYSSLQHRRI